MVFKYFIVCSLNGLYVRYAHTLCFAKINKIFEIDAFPLLFFDSVSLFVFARQLQKVRKSKMSDCIILKFELDINDLTVLVEEKI